MKLSCLPVSFFCEIIEGRMSVAQWAQIGSAVGLDAIDLSTLFVHDSSPAILANLRSDIETAGVSVAMVTSYQDFTHPDPAQRKRELDRSRETIRIAASLGAKYLHVTAGQAHPQTPREAGIDWALFGLSQLIEFSRGSGVELVIENHSRPSVWEYADFSQSPDIFLEIVRRTDELGLGVNFDTANATAFADDPAILLSKLVDRVVTVHTADTAVRGALKMVLLGTGIVPFLVLFRQLKEFGFDGWICIEEGSFMGQGGLEAAVHFVREAWTMACETGGMN